MDLENVLAIESASDNKSDFEPASAPASSYEGPTYDLKNLIWRKIDGPFVSIWLHNVPWGSETTMAAPEAQVCLELHFKLVSLSFLLFLRIL